MVQQSFYAGNAYANDGYQPGYYNGQLWGYNPVQGGSSSAAGSKKSKIVDVIVSDNSIYVKCMPRDWATGNFAYSYMENIYTLTNDGVQIDNRFFDWSGYTFNAVDQELPAFTPSVIWAILCGTAGLPPGHMVHIPRKPLCRFGDKYPVGLKSMQVFAATTHMQRRKPGVHGSTVPTGESAFTHRASHSSLQADMPTTDLLPPLLPQPTMLHPW